MNAEISEAIFEKYLIDAQKPFSRDFIAYGKKNLDFCIGEPAEVLCDVKEVRASDDARNEDIDAEYIDGKALDAHARIRDDIKSLRQKLGKNTLQLPSVLVSMNFSDMFFTGFSVQQALLGDIGFDEKIRSDAHHLNKGNAQFTEKHNTSVSGVLVFDETGGNHRFFENPFAKYPLAEGYFPDVEFVKMKRFDGEDELVDLTKIMFWPIEVDEVQLHRKNLSQPYWKPKTLLILGIVLVTIIWVYGDTLF